MRRFELIEGTASKFWEVEQAGRELNIRWGRIGTAGQSQTKDFDDEAKAGAALTRLVKEKTSKGYAETGVAAGAAIGKAAAAAPPKPKPAATAAPKSAVPPAAGAPSAAAPTASAASAAPPAESIDAQAERAFQTLRAQIAAGELKAGDPLSASQIKRLQGVGDMAAAMAFERLGNFGLLSGWGASRTISNDAPKRIEALADAMDMAYQSFAPASAAAAGDADADAPPWLAGGAPIRFTATMRAAAYASRRFPRPVASLSAPAAWLLVRRAFEAEKEGRNASTLDLQASDAALRPAVQRVTERLALPEPPADPQADTALLALALGTADYYGGSQPGVAVVDYLVAQYGLPGAVDVFLAGQQLQVQTDYDRARQIRTTSLTGTVIRPMSNGWRGPLGQGEEILRGHLAAAAPEVWQLCVDRIEAALPGLHPSRQPVLALLLPDAPALSNALALSLGAAKDTPETLHWLLLTATEPAAIAQAAKVRPGYSTGFWGHHSMVSTLLLERGLEAVALLERGAAQDEAGDALACIGTPEAVAALARAASSSKGALARLARLALAADRWPLAAIAALARMVAAGGKDAGLVAPMLTRLLRAHGAALPALRPWLEPAAREAIDRQLALLSGPAEVADAGELPPVLAAPPWLAKTQKKAAEVLALAPLALAPVERWEEGAREKALQVNKWAAHHHANAKKDMLEMIDGLGFDSREKYYGPLGEAAAAAIRQGDAQTLIASWRAMVAERKKARYYWFRFQTSYVALLPAALGVPFWNTVAGETVSDDIGLMLATHGLAVLPGLIAMVRSAPSENLAYALNFGAVELAPTAARAFAKLKTLREAGRDWLLKYPEHAACALIAPALGKAGEARDCAGAALRLLRANGHEALLLEVAARHGQPEAVQALRAVLDESPLDRFPAKRAKLPEFWQPRGWRRPVLHSGKALPDDALDALGQMLTFPTNEEVYAGIADVKAACAPDSLADFAWDAFAAWLAAGGPGKEGWALAALGRLGTDDTARRLTPFIRAWPGESAHARAVTGLDVLAGIGTDVALMLLNGIAQKIKFKGLQDKAREKIDAIAEARGLSAEELEDRLAPDLGLDARGSLLLDFGPRAFKVGFDEALKPYVREHADGVDGARLPDLPKPKKTDDPEKATEAVERFKLLKKDARTIASQQLLRLEVAMCARRRWTPEVFRAFLVEHPLVRHLVQRLVWGAYAVDDGGSHGGRLLACFRVAEDGSFTTAGDDAFELPAGETVRIGVPHALEVSAADAAAFGQVFADYELLQPFAQIGRDIYTLSEDEKKSQKLERWKGVKVPTGRVLGLVNKGWRRGHAQDGGGIWYFNKPLGGEKVIELYLDPGITVGMVNEEPEQTLGEVQVGKSSGWGEMREADAFEKLDPISASELIRDMEGLRA